MYRILKRFAICLACLLVLVPACTIGSSALTGEESITIYITNPPSGKYYVDLLVEKDYLGDEINCDASQYDEVLLKKLHSFEADGWYPVVAGSTAHKVEGNLIGEMQDDRIMFTYASDDLPESYRIIVVSEIGEIRSSRPLTRSTAKRTVEFDCATTKFVEASRFDWAVLQFLCTFVVTALCAIAFLPLFGLSIKRNIVFAIVISLVSQLFYNLSTWTFIVNESVRLASAAQLVAGAIVISAAAVLATNYVVGKRRVYRIWYAITAYTVAFVISFAAIYIYTY